MTRKTGRPRLSKLGPVKQVKFHLTPETAKAFDRKRGKLSRGVFLSQLIDA